MFWAKVVVVSMAVLVAREVRRRLHALSRPSIEVRLVALREELQG
jgi:hypothetical protein